MADAAAPEAPVAPAPTPDKPETPTPAAAPAPEKPAAPASSFTVTSTATASGSAPVRRGRGTFSHRLRTEEIEQRAQQMRARELNEGSSVMTAATTTVVLPQSVLGRIQPTEEDTLAAQFAQVKKNIPLETNPAPAPNIREYFGAFDAEQEAIDTVRQLLFRGEKRRRYCIIVGDLQSAKRLVTLKLFGHRGNKPFKLQDKLIRLINLSIGKPRPRKYEGLMDGTEYMDDETPEGPYLDWEEEDDDDEIAPSPAAAAPADTTTATEADDAGRVLENADDVAAQRAAHEAAGFPADQPITEEDSEASRSAPVPEIATPIHGAIGEHLPKKEENESPVVDSIAAKKDEKPTSEEPTASATEPNEKADEHDDVDHYFEREDEVVPLTVQRDEDTMNANELSLANSPVLTSKYFASLTAYFMKEFTYLLSMEDVRSQNVSVNVNLGAAYCCLARHGSYTTPLRHATFGQFVERMNDESMQLYFIKDCPTCVSRAVDRECGTVYHDSTLTLVKIFFFSNERQSRSVARAVWDGEKNEFRLLDMENVGVSFNWSIFSLDESFVRKEDLEPPKPTSIINIPPGPPMALGGDDDDDLNVVHMDPTMDLPPEDAAPKTIRNKTVAYPFEVEFRAFRRWKQHGDHPAAPLAEAILEKISVAEYNLINHGSSIGYERMDLSKVCEADYAAEDFNVESIVVEHTARMKPEGTDITVDTTTSLFIENFAAARSLKEKIAQYGPASVAAMQNASNNNYMRGRGMVRRGGRGGAAAATDPQSVNMEEALQPTSKLTFFRARGTTIHWKFKPGCSVEENLAPMAEALNFVQQVLHTANDIERNSARGGAAPDALE